MCSCAHYDYNCYRFGLPISQIADLINVHVFAVLRKMREAEGYQYTTKEGADLEKTLVELKVNKPVVTMKVSTFPFLPL